MKFFPSSIQNYLVATMACLCVPGIGALGYMAEQSILEVRSNMQLGELVQADKALLLAGNAIRTARGQAQTSIGRRRPGRDLEADRGRQSQPHR